MLYIYLLILFFSFLFLLHLGECFENRSLGDVSRLPGQLFLWNYFAAFRHKMWFFCSPFQIARGSARKKKINFFILSLKSLCTTSTNVPMSILVKVVIIWGGWWGNRELDVSKLFPLNMSRIFIFNWLTNFQLCGNPAQQWDLEIFCEWPWWTHMQVGCELNLIINSRSQWS